jgi:DNA polymerase-3 subunit alpha
LEDLKAIRGRDLKLAGIIKNVQHRISKNGKPFGTFVLEDFTESKEFSLFGEDYIKFKSFLEDRYPVILVGKSAARWQKADQKGPEDLEFKISKIELLSEARTKWGRYLNITIDKHLFNIELLQKLDDNLMNAKGGAQLRIRVKDGESTINTLSGNKNQILISDETIDFLKSLGQLEFSISEN